jgi:hypothetical protein
MRFKALSVGVVAASALSLPAWAHHSFSMFDADNPVTKTGTVKQFEWSNPHSWLQVMVEDKATGKPVEWTLELGSPVQQERIGWVRDSLKPGDKVTVTLMPMKDGSRAGRLLTATLPNGRTIGNRVIPPDSERSSRSPGGQPAGISE